MRLGHDSYPYQMSRMSLSALGKVWPPPRPDEDATEDSTEL